MLVFPPGLVTREKKKQFSWDKINKDWSKYYFHSIVKCIMLMKILVSQSVKCQTFTLNI